MPYLPPETRWDWRCMVRSTCIVLRDGNGTVPGGVLNYLVTELAIAWLGPTPNYERFNAAVGALECAKLELYRRMIAPYEDKKIAENGDVYE